MINNTLHFVCNQCDADTSATQSDTFFNVLLSIRIRQLGSIFTKRMVGVMYALSFITYPLVKLKGMMGNKSTRLLQHGVVSVEYITWCQNNSNLRPKENPRALTTSQNTALKR